MADPLITHCEHGTYLKEEICFLCDPIPNDLEDPRNSGPVTLDAGFQIGYVNEVQENTDDY